jgi:hypothetical protein
MNKKRITVFLCILTLALGALALALGRQEQSSLSLKSKRADIPEHVVYKHLFHHIAALKRKAEEAESEGKDATQFRTHFKRQAVLSDEQDQIINDIAADCDRQIKEQDEKAKVLIRAYKAQYPGGQVPHGELPKPPPAELRALSEERDAIVLRSRDRLKAALGDSEFERFNGFVKERIAPNVYQIKPQQSPSKPAER